MKKLLLFVPFLVACAFSHAVTVPFNFTIIPPASGADGYFLYQDCDGDKSLIAEIGESETISVDVVNGSTVYFCASAYILDASNSKNEGPSVNADPFFVDLVVTPGAPGSITITLDCAALPEGLACVVSP